MLKTLRLSNFRCFSNHEIEFEKVSVVVGENNAGKTTVSEALRLVSIVSERHMHLPYKAPPEWLEASFLIRGCAPSLKGLQIDFDSIFNHYGPPPAEINALFSSGEKINIYLGPEEKIFSTIEDSEKNIVKSKAHALKLTIPPVSIMPQAAPLVKIEKVLAHDYVRGALSSSVAPQHFRNQLYYNDSLWDDFKQLVEKTWQSLQVLELIKHGEIGEEVLSLNIRDRDFVAEVGVMGHGLQIWMQTVWFLVRAKRSPTVILDEPDVYLHADLQRKLIRILQDEFPQVILMTHSTEIMAEVQPNDIILINRNRPRSTRISTLPGVQQVAEGFGSIHNILLTRLWSSKRFLLVEGGDIRLLKQLQNTLFPKSEHPLDIIPNMSIGGWGGWSYAVGSSLFLKNSAGEAIVVVCILDSDYHTPDQIRERLEDARKKGVCLHIWKRKEIENYLLVPRAIQRCIAKRITPMEAPPIDLIETMIDEFASDLKDTAFDAFCQEFLASEKSRGAGGANPMARRHMEQRIGEMGLPNVVSGKDIISRLSGWSQEKWGTSLSSNSICRALEPHEIESEIRKVLEMIEGKSVWPEFSSSL